MAMDFDPYYKWLGIALEEQPPHHYRLLGIRPFEKDLDVIEHAADQRMAHLRTFQAGKHSAFSQKLLNEVAAAKLCLLKSDKKVDYDAKLHDLLDRQSSGEDTSTQLKNLLQLSEVLASEASRPVSKPRPKSSNTTSFLAAGGVLFAVAVAALVWKSGQEEVGSRRIAVGGSRPTSSEPGGLPAGRNTTAADSKAESGKPKAEKSRQKSTVMGQGTANGSVSQPVAPSPTFPVPPTSGPMEVGSTQSPSPGTKSPAPASSGSGQSAKPQGPSPKTKDPIPNPALYPTASNQPSVVSSQAAAGGKQPAVGGVASSPAPSPSLPAPLPLPDEASRAAALRQAQELFRDDYTKAKKPAERAELGRKILKQGQAPGNAPAERFALLSLSRDVAVSADDDRLAFEAIDELSKAFAINALAQKTEVLQSLAKAAKTLPAHKTLCERALALGRETVAADKFSLADVLAKLAFTEAGKVHDRELVQRSRALAKDQQDASKAFATVEEAFKTLNEKPDNPAANLVAGKYSCYVKRDWSKGVLQLAKGNDVVLKSLAEEERKITPPEWEPAPGVMPPDPPPAAAALRIADGWWDAGQVASGKQRDPILLHAGYWYRQSFGSDTAPLVATKINGRLEHIEKIRRQYPAPPLAIAPFDAQQAREHQRRWAQYLGVPTVMTNSIGMKFVLIPPGEFDMGATEQEVELLMKGKEVEKLTPSSWYIMNLRNAIPKHRVRVTNPFYFAVYEVTQAEYQQVTGNNPSDHSASGKESARVRGQDPRRLPVEKVSRHDSREFCRRLVALSAQTRVGQVYRLPTEAEWEYACSTGDGPVTPLANSAEWLSDRGWLYTNSGGTPHPVGCKAANAYGLFDMHGNVWEWCADEFTPDYYVHSPSVNPAGPISGKSCVCRGGAYCHIAASSHCTFRFSRESNPDYVGFRVVFVP